MGFTLTVKKRVLRRVLRRGSEKAVSRRCLEHSIEEYAPLGVRPSESKSVKDFDKNGARQSYEVGVILTAQKHKTRVAPQPSK